MENLEKVEMLVQGINSVHKEFSDFYFNSEERKINLSRTIRHIPLEHIKSYRLNLHESINDYIWKLLDRDFKFVYRVKTTESVDDKIERYSQKANQAPVSNWLNDLFGARIIVSDELYEQIKNSLHCWEEKFGLKNWYEREVEEYRGVHIYFKNQANFHFAWELQVWKRADVEMNIASHRKYKRAFVR